MCVKGVRETVPSLHSVAPFNPTVSLPPKLVKRILDLEFEMAEVTNETEPVQVPGHPPPPARLLIADISQWVECYSLMVATWTFHLPGHNSSRWVQLWPRAMGFIWPPCNFIGRPWPARTSISRWQIQGSTTRLSRVGTAQNKVLLLSPWRPHRTVLP